MKVVQKIVDEGKITESSEEIAQSEEKKEYIFGSHGSTRRTEKCCIHLLKENKKYMQNESLSNEDKGELWAIGTEESEK